MTDTLFDRASEGPAPFRIREVGDRRQLDAILSDDRAYAAYALGHLETGVLERSHFWLAEGPGGAGMVMHASAMGPTVITSGDALAVDAILSLHPGPRRAYLSTASPRHLAALERTYRVRDLLRMTRMSVDRTSFEAGSLADETAGRGDARRMRGVEVNAINALYATDGAPSRYGAEQIDRSIYYGAFEAGRLVSVAGTHIVSPEMAIGVVGNVFTHPARRGAGLAQRTTARVTQALFDAGCTLVTLTVDRTNAPAVRAYERLGYAAGAAVVEARLERRDAIGIGAWLRRRRARRPDGSEERASGRLPAADEGANR